MYSISFLKKLNSLDGNSFNVVLYDNVRTGSDNLKTMAILGVIVSCGGGYSLFHRWKEMEL